MSFRRFWQNSVVAVFCAASLGAAAPSQAGVVVSATRVVYSSDSREVSVRLTNEGGSPVLVQTWLDTGDEAAKPEALQVPFTLAPPVFRMNPGRGQTIRMMYTKEPLPQDRETVFWLNVLEIPPKVKGADGANHLQVAFRSRIKVFFRPKGLAGTPDEAPSKVIWSVVPMSDGGGYGLKATNPTPYAVSYGKVSLESGGQSLEAQSTMVLPDTSRVFPLTGGKGRPSGGAKVSYQYIDDFGAVRDGSSVVN
ncbi:Pili assembly chaperone, N-terminal (plasmid) [Burkholderia ambifaria MC40-6]|uniref:Pili assembly chaperone, N-terminal n=2 Tax=Burkholderia ambifaria TaxID=152480 RepID=B1Z6H6_BURA4|nr:fimbria/pilus periplasmic chaperone [Burkholderia ambifaria]ACB69053.1 Pili assembly chaperone, N-terminal [Burkholderia ambifaria MC40-6]